MCIWEGNEKFHTRESAYFLPKMRGKGAFKAFFSFFKYLLQGQMYVGP